ncbi:NAD(P)-dependent oxidoreductase [Nocardioides marmoriginsengisoli]|uniref:NAD(P)-dependent oxidoreductase n=1 Tax=Nocardioides marmoriginsengisoli TaxID=661483 RepID=A0A3N0CG77_9ACTN|nr:mycofactocin-coupled SDR family oxidoreductase [Nocardioides marmoriginsengisoli]RNL62447.1 NAD(P)-dependent oxidoreductase [Nocardioides marmoriginsengisoli]
MTEPVDRVVLVTGGAKGQGRNHALAFARQGARVGVMDICRQFPGSAPMATEEDLATTQKLLGEAGADSFALVGDTRSSADMRRFVDTAVERWGRVDVFVANAGVASFGPVVEMTDPMWDDVVSTNLDGVATSIRAVIPTMVAQRSGRIIATSSSVAREGGPNNANYAASKWGVIGFVKSVAIELAPLGITVNAFSPMSVSTDMCHNEATYKLFRPDLADPQEDDVRETFAGLNPMHVPWLELEDATAGVLYLASEGARYVTGAALDVAGGWNAYHGA